MTDLENDQRLREIFHGLTIPPETWPVLRVDGRSFSRFTEKNFDKPFDARFSDHMITTAKALVEELDGLYAYTESDEISVLLQPDVTLFNRSVEKFVSISASIASATFTHAFGAPVHFDSRVWAGTGIEDVLDYFSWRQADAARCALNGWSYWALRQYGLTAGKATSALFGLGPKAKHDLLLAHGIDFADAPIWQRRGIGVLWETYDKTGLDPRTDTEVVVQRRRLRVQDALAAGADYRSWLREILEEVQ